jgi:large subunit ribosomal protein L17
MHRHGYKGKKFNRKTDQRKALIVGLAESLVLRESIETTLPRAKQLKSYTEKLITKAKKGGLHNRRQVLSGLSTVEAAHKLVDEIAPKLSGRTSGHLRVVRTSLRRGDAAQMARISFVDDLTAKAKKPAEKAPVAAKKPAKASAKAVKAAK